jgi:hypothetical protein
MICLGSPQMAPSSFHSEAAQLHVVNWFRQYFLRKYPSGIVISELEYMGRTTFAQEAPTPLRMFGQPRINQILDALAHDFRRWSKERDYRKCDVLGLANDGFTAELLEVTTENNAASAIAQVYSKLAILRETVNRIHNLTVDWRPSPWKPEMPRQLFAPLGATATDITYLCYAPTFRAAPALGVVLYEVHRLAREKVAVPVAAPREAQQRVRQAMPRQGDVESRARDFLRTNPDLAGWIRTVAAVLAVAAVIVAIVAIIDPVPGDEVAAAYFAAALFRVAVGRGM